MDFNGAPVPASLHPVLTWIDGLDSHLQDRCTGNPGPVDRALSTAGHYAIKRHILIPGFALSFCLGVATGHDGLRRAGELGVIGLVASATASRGIKAHVRRRRPDECEPRRRSNRRISARSFPSGHAASAFAAATALAAVTRNPAQAALVYGGAAMLATGRVFRHRHWASDVLAGALLGTAVTWIAGAFLTRKDRAPVSA